MPGAPVVKSVAPPVYRPNPAPHVLQRKTFQPAKPSPARPPEATSALLRRAVERGQRPPVQMKAHSAVRPPRAIVNTGVVQRVIVIKQYGKSAKKRTFTVKNSKSESSYKRSADCLINRLDKKGFKAGWISHLRDMVSDKLPTPNHVYDTLDDLAVDLARTFPLADENKKRKREEKKQILKEHRTNLDNIKPEQSRRGKKIRLGSFIGMNKLTGELFETDALEQNIDDLTSNFSTTDGGGKSLKLDTGSIFQSQLALSLANLDNDVKGAFLEGKYVRVNDGLGQSEGIRKKPFVEIPTRLKTTRVYGDGAYKKDEIVEEDLPIFESIRLGENTVGSEFRHMMVEEGKLKDTDEFNPVGRYALSEIPGATKGENRNNQLMDQNSYKVFNKAKKKINKSKVIGRNAHKLPKGTNVSTLESYTNAYNQVTTNHNKDTQNEFHRQNFYISRSTFYPFYDENNEEYVPRTPPGSPLNQDYNYDSTN